jgi:hypothetical protein
VFSFIRTEDSKFFKRDLSTRHQIQAQPPSG